MSEETIPPPTVVDQEISAGPDHQSSNYHQQKRRALRSGQLYEDPYFEPVDSNLFFSKRPPRPFVWKRPKEICSDPKFFTNGASRFDIKQGMLGNCWFLSAMSSLTTQPGLLKRVVPEDQGFGRDYAGIFYFHFWQFGEWKDVVIDDRLPTYNNKLVFARSGDDSNEFWAALLEKAYAKLHGSYEALKSGQGGEAMIDFTGGVVETFELKRKPPHFQLMLKATQRSSLMTCSITAKPNEIEAKAGNGLRKGIGYAVTGVNKVRAGRSGTEVELVRVRIPWGNETEWEGAWSDKSPEWGALTDQDKSRLQISFEDDGEFWMSYGDFIAYFDRLEICNVELSDILLGEEKLTWDSITFQGIWRKGTSAGGCRNFIQTFDRNPQFRIKLEDTDVDEDDKCTVIVALMQKGRRQLKERMGPSAMLTIGFSIYKMTEEEQKSVRLSKEFFQYHASTARSHVFINCREVQTTFHLDPGHYCIIPSTFDPNQEGQFILRVFTEANRGREPPARQDTAATPAAARQPADKAMDARFAAMFERLAGRDGEMDVFELQQMLSASLKSELTGRDFSIVAAKAFISMVDKDGSGKLGLEEFKTVYFQIKKWIKNYKVADTDNSGSLDTYQLRQFLRNAGGYTFSNKTLLSITLRIGNRKGNVDADECIGLMAKLVRVQEIVDKGLPKTSGEFMERLMESMY